MPKILATTTAVAFAATSIYLYRLQTQISPIPNRQISSSLHIPPSFQTCPSARLVNPNNHVITTDTRSITLKLAKNLSDEEILARFTKGFFGGYVFGPERGVLRMFRKELFGFNDTPVSSQIWSETQISRQSVPPLHALLFGAFRVLGRDISLPSATAGSQSYVDFAHGSDGGLIAGVHRFSVSRDGVGKDGEDGKVKVEFACLVCNPRENKPIVSNMLHKFHLCYAVLLFREGCAEVMRE